MHSEEAQSLSFPSQIRRWSHPKNPPRQLGQPTPRCELTATHPDQPTPDPHPMPVPRAMTGTATGPGQRPAEAGVRQKRASDRTRRPERATRGVPGGRPPGKALRAQGEGPLKGAEDRATPGGYGGKPPGVAIIGVPTGARNAGSGAPTGDQSTDMNATRKHPLVCQDPITTRSETEAEQQNQLSRPPGPAGRCPFSDDGPAGSRVVGRLGRYSMKPRVLLGSRPPLAKTTAK
jgi:hypothetical protein